jgi:hypothetical protein
VRAILQRLVSGYDPSSEVVDWVHLELEGVSGSPEGHREFVQ